MLMSNYGVKQLGPSDQKQLFQYRFVERLDDNAADDGQAACGYYAQAHRTSQDAGRGERIEDSQRRRI